MNLGLIGGIVGTVLGLVGGAIGTWATVHNTSGPRERAFTIKAAAAFWVGGILFIALLVLLPTPWRFLLWLPYGILLPLAIIGWNRTQRRIRDQERHECLTD
jgi:hypothetical protein